MTDRATDSATTNGVPRGQALGGSPCSTLLARVRQNDDWLAHCQRLYRDEQKRIGAYARSIRKKSGLSLREVARRMKVSAPFLSDLERGNRYWTTHKIEAWASSIK